MCEVILASTKFAWYTTSEGKLDNEIHRQLAVKVPFWWQRLEGRLLSQFLKYIFTQIIDLSLADRHDEYDSLHVVPSHLRSQIWKAVVQAHIQK